MALFPFEPPTLMALVRRVTDDVRTRLGTAASLLSHTAEAALATAVAGVAHPLWRALDRASRVSLWATALDTTYLQIWASIFGVVRKPAGKATGVLAVTGTGLTVVPALTRFQRSPDGFEYETTEDTALSGGGEADVPIRARTAGELGNALINTHTHLIGNVPGVNALAVIAADITDGTEEESLVDLAARFLDRLRSPPRGGGAGDYKRWAKEIDFVTRCWEYGGEPQLGYVTIRCVADFEDADTEALDEAERTEVYDYIKERMPLGLELVVEDDVVITALNPNILIEPDSDAAKEAGERALRLALSKGQIGVSTFSLSLLNQALLDEPLITEHEFVSPVGNIAVDALEVLTLGTVDWDPFP